MKALALRERGPVRVRGLGMAVVRGGWRLDWGESGFCCHPHTLRSPRIGPCPPYAAWDCEGCPKYGELCFLNLYYGLSWL